MRVKAGVLLLCASAVVYAVEICRRTHVLTKAPPDHVTLQEVRLAGLKKRLPADGNFGYVADDFNEVDKDAAWRKFATTQYSLAPIVLERTAERELVVGVFKDPNAIPAVAAGSGLLVVEDFGHGVVLFKKK
jgi:hypothetical protein